MRTSIAHILAAASILAAAPALAAERSFPVSDFSEIVLAGSPEVTVTTGGRASVVATGTDSDLDRLDIKVDGKRLLIGTKPGKWNWSSREGVKLRVSVPTLAAATISGSGDISVNRVDGPFAGRISGSGASLAGLEVALETGDPGRVDDAVARLLLAHAVVLGFDGSRGRAKGKPDATALIGCRVADGHLFELGIWEADDQDKKSWETWAPPIPEVEATLAPLVSSRQFTPDYGHLTVFGLCVDCAAAPPERRDSRDA